MAPARTADGETVRGLGAGRAVSAFPLVSGTPGHFDDTEHAWQALTGTVESFAAGA
ncbi:hypothetical protein ACIBBB_30655 [Streptomyces sp. NPDC051217]|uniref:hypothetical protein n=1 Tax=Streptomyces sp. NPDC051217 TaxID=3365644 RepID=UPI0037925B4B